jgi:hypothetical protein
LNSIRREGIFGAVRDIGGEAGMATIVQGTRSRFGEERFFFLMACIMAAVITAGFSFNLATGRSSFALPLVYHVHAFVFFGWVALYLAQTFLVSRDVLVLHRKLGWLSVGFVPAMVALGIAVTVNSLRRGGPPFFDQNEFLFVNPIALLCFAGLVAAAVARRRRTDWHRRIMFSAMAILTGPGLGRLLPMPLFIPWAWWVVVGASMLFPVAGMLFDYRRTGRVHPAWTWSLIAILGTQAVAELIAYSAFGISVTEHLIAGTPGADRPMAAFFPA